jgi:recombination protein RecA
MTSPKVFSSGSKRLNDVLGVGGMPFGHMVELYGGEASGKTTISFHAIVELQRLGKTAAYIDGSHSFDPAYARQLGVDIEKLAVITPNSLEEAFDTAEFLTGMGGVSLIVIDSIHQLPSTEPEPEPEPENLDERDELGQWIHPKSGLSHKLLFHGMNKLRHLASKTDTCLLHTNGKRHLYLAYAYSAQIETKRITAIYEAGKECGYTIQAKGTKNKWVPPGGIAEISFIKGKVVPGD